MDNKIVNLIDEGAIADEIEEADTFKATMVKIEKYCAPPTDSPAPPHSSSPAVIHISASPSPHVRLLKLTIKPFNGYLTAWTT